MNSSPNVHLEQVDASHLDDLLDAIEASLPELSPWMGWAVDWNRQESVHYLRSANDPNDIAFAVTVDGRASGIIGILVPKPVQSWGEIGYWLRSDLSGRKIMTEGLRQAIEWAFTVRGLHRLELRAALENAPSNRLAEKHGFSLRGVVREAARGSNGWYDCNLWDLLATDPR